MTERPDGGTAVKCSGCGITVQTTSPELRDIFLKNCLLANLSSVSVASGSKTIMRRLQ